MRQEEIARLQNELTNTLNEQADFLARQGSDKPLEKWHIDGDIYLWMFDYFLCPRLKAGVQKVSEPEGEKFERISEQELVNVTNDGQGVHFEFEGKTYNIESGVRPNVYNLNITE